MFAKRRNKRGTTSVASYRRGGGDRYSMDRCEAYHRFAAQCIELSRTMDSPHDCSILLQMALVWSRLAEYRAKHVGLNEPIESE
jgi:hypothetical protein